jgi:polysaccharide deacetylase 2 family uncharacterized protein YibQ
MVILINKNIISTTLEAKQTEKSLLGGKKHYKGRAICSTSNCIKPLANVFKTKDRFFTDALCSTQSLVNRVAEYIIGGKTIIRNESFITPFKRVLIAYSDSSFYVAKAI